MKRSTITDLRFPHQRLSMAVGTLHVLLWLVALFLDLATPLDTEPYGSALTRIALVQALFLSSRLLQNGFALMDVVLIHSLLLTLYAIVYPLFYAVTAFAIFGLSETPLRHAIGAYNGATLSFWAATLLFHSTRETASLNSRLQAGMRALLLRFARVPAWPTVAVLVLLSLYHSYHLYVTGGFDSSLTRAEFYRVTGDLQWWKTKFAIVACAAFLLLRTVGVYLATQRSRTRLLASLGCSAAVPWTAAQLYVGTRHQVVILVLLALILVWLFARPPVRRMTVLLGVPAVVVLFILIGVVRQTRSTNAQNVQPAIEALGEFVFPYQVLMVVLEPGRDRLGGKSYLRSVLFWLPSDVWPSKPRPLQENFMADLGVPGVIGFGFNPLAEAVENFGSAGPILFGVGFASLLLLLRWAADRVPLLYILVLTQTASVWRSELTTIVEDVILLGFMISFAYYASLPVSRLALFPLRPKVRALSPTTRPQT